MADYDPQRIEANGAERAEIGIAVSKQDPDQEGGELVAEALMRLQRALLGLAQRAGTEDEIGASFENRFQQAGSFARIVA